MTLLSRVSRWSYRLRRLGLKRPISPECQWSVWPPGRTRWTRGSLGCCCCCYCCCRRCHDAGPQCKSWGKPCNGVCFGRLCHDALRTRIDSGGNTLMDSEQICLFRNGSKRSRCENAVEHLIIFRIPRRWNSILKRSFSGFWPLRELSKSFYYLTYIFPRKSPTVWKNTPKSQRIDLITHEP